MIDTSTRASSRRTANPPALLDSWSIAVVVLGSIQPFTAFLATNATSMIEPKPVFVVGIVWAVVMVAAFVGVRLLTRATAALPVAAGFVAFNLSFWNFGRWLSSEPGSAGRRWVALLIWALVTVLVVRLAMKLGELASARAFIVIFLSVWILASIGGFAIGRSSITGGDQPTVYSGPAFASFQDHPDVYWFILDEHARSDQLRTWTGVDNSFFADGLAERGFNVSESTQAGYPHTHLSISSTLAMDYAYTPGHDYRGEYALSAPLTRGDNPVVSTFEANGYRYVYAPDGSVEWSVCPTETKDRVCVAPLGGPLGFREPYLQLALASPVGSFDLGITHNTLDSVLDGVEDVQAQSDQPLFVMAHILSPHQPYRYETDCSWRAAPVVGTQLSGEERAAAYANDVQCLDQQFLDATDRILAQDPNAVIIVQSDHGSRLSFNWDQPYDEWTPAMLRERFGALNAMRLPPACRDRSIDGVPLVDTFRIVMACLGHAEPDLLPTRTFFSGYGDISSLVEVPPDRFVDP